MPRKIGSKSSESVISVGRTCPDCGGDLSEWPPKPEIRHCPSISFSFGTKCRGALKDKPHHTHELHPRCWLCHEPQGCLLCSGPSQELLCENIKAHNGLGAVWSTKWGFLNHGPMIRQRSGRAQTLADYPAPWATEYEPLELNTAASMKFLDELMSTIGKPMPEPDPRDFDQS